MEYRLKNLNSLCVMCGKRTFESNDKKASKVSSTRNQIHGNCCFCFSFSQPSVMIMNVSVMQWIRNFEMIHFHHRYFLLKLVFKIDFLNKNKLFSLLDCRFSSFTRRCCY